MKKGKKKLTPLERSRRWFRSRLEDEQFNTGFAMMQAAKMEKRLKAEISQLTVAMAEWRDIAEPLQLANHRLADAQEKLLERCQQFQVTIEKLERDLKAARVHPATGPWDVDVPSLWEALN